MFSAWCKRDWDVSGDVTSVYTQRMQAPPSTSLRGSDLIHRVTEPELGGSWRVNDLVRLREHQPNTASPVEEATCQEKLKQREGPIDRNHFSRGNWTLLCGKLWGLALQSLYLAAFNPSHTLWRMGKSDEHDPQNVSLGREWNRWCPKKKKPHWNQHWWKSRVIGSFLKEYKENNM